MSSFLGRGPRVSDEQKKRIPPGQYFTEKWPVLHYGSVPRVDLKTWDFKVWGEVDNPFELSWAEFKTLPRKSLHTDIHCVTRWSRLDMDFEGVPIQVILERAQLRPAAKFVVAHAEQGYTTNLPLSVLDDDDVILADMADGAPLTPDHGYPLRLVVPEALLLEERQVGARPPVHAGRQARLSGSATATTTTPIPGRKSASAKTDPAVSGRDR